MPLTLGLLKTELSLSPRTRGLHAPAPTFLPLRFLRMGCSDSAWGWAWNELLFELAGLVLCLAAWEVTGCLPGLGGRPQEGAPRKSLTPTAATSTATTACPLGPHLQLGLWLSKSPPQARSQRLEVEARDPSP